MSWSRPAGSLHSHHHLAAPNDDRLALLMVTIGPGSLGKSASVRLRPGATTSRPQPTCVRKTPPRARARKGLKNVGQPARSRPVRPRRRSCERRVGRTLGAAQKPPVLLSALVRLAQMADAVVALESHRAGAKMFFTVTCETRSHPRTLGFHVECGSNCRSSFFPEMHADPGLARISLLAGKKQGISSVLASVIRISHRKSLLDQSLTTKFPTHRNREAIGLLQGIWSAHQGSPPLDQGRPRFELVHGVDPKFLCDSLPRIP